MVNWYKEYINKIARRGTDRPLMDEYSEFGKQDKDYSLTKSNPFFGGKERKTPDGKGYPKGISEFEDSDDNIKGTGYDEIQPGRTILDDEISNSPEIDNEIFVADEDKIPIKQEQEPVGPHNMSHNKIKGDIFDSISRRSRIKGLSRI